MVAACLEAAQGETQVEGFEVGVFSGKYVTEVPEGYFEHLRQLRGEKKDVDTFLAANGAPVVPASKSSNGLTSPDYHEDISIHNLAS